MLKSLRASLLLLLLLAPLLAPVAGCKEIRKFMPPTTIDNPAEGTREWLVYKTIEASQLKDDKAAWEKLRPLLHSDVIGNTASENSFRTMNFPALRRKVKSFTPDDAKPTCSVRIRCARSAIATLWSAVSACPPSSKAITTTAAP